MTVQQLASALKSSKRSLKTVISPMSVFGAILGGFEAESVLGTGQKLPYWEPTGENQWI
jgi:hypothetical protein